MGFKCTSLLFSIWCMIIFLACFSLQPTLGFTCGDFGYNCINQRYYQKCDKEKNTRDIKVISVCPRNTICVQRRPNPCQPSKENTLEQISLEQDQKLATQSSEEKAAVKQIIKEKMSDSAPLGNQDDSINVKTPSSSAGNQGRNEAIEMKNLGSTTPISASTALDHSASTTVDHGASTTVDHGASTTLDHGASSAATPATHPTPHAELDTKVVKEKGQVTEHYTAEEHKEEAHDKTGEHHAEEHKEEGHEKSGEHQAEEHKEEEHEKSGEHHAEEHKEEGHEKSGEHHAEEHKEEGHEKSGEHHAEEHKEDHEKTGEHHGEEHKEDHEHKEGHKEEHEKSDEHHAEEHKEDHEKTGEHHGDEHKEDHKEVESDSEAEEHVKHDNAKEDQHAEHGNHEEPKKHPEEHTTAASKKEIFGKKTKRGFICSDTGTFPDKSSGECFYLCYRIRRSSSDGLKAISVCCPPGMFFNNKTHKCTDNEKKADKTKLSRLKRRRRWRGRG